MLLVLRRYSLGQIDLLLILLFKRLLWYLDYIFAFRLRDTVNSITFIDDDAVTTSKKLLPSFHSLWSNRIASLSWPITWKNPLNLLSTFQRTQPKVYIFCAFSTLPWFNDSFHSLLEIIRRSFATKVMLLSPSLT